MKIRIKHKETEFIIEDNGDRTDTYNNLISNNNTFIFNLIEKITQHIIEINNVDKK